MAPDKDRPGKEKERKAAAAYRVKALGRPLQRGRLQKRSEAASDSAIAAAAHGEEVSLESRTAPPRDDRAG